MKTDKPDMTIKNAVKNLIGFALIAMIVPPVAVVLPVSIAPSIALTLVETTPTTLAEVVEQQGILIKKLENEQSFLRKVRSVVKQQAGQLTPEEKQMYAEILEDSKKRFDSMVERAEALGIIGDRIIKAGLPLKQ